LKQALNQIEGGKTSLAGAPSPQAVPLAPASSKPLIEVLEQGVKNAERCKDLIPNLQSMIAGCDADANGKVSVSELGFAADMVVSAVEGVESKEDVIKRFDKNGDGMLSKEEINKVAEGVALSLQYKMAQVMLLKGEDAKFEDDDTKARWLECKKQLEAYSPPE